MQQNDLLGMSLLTPRVPPRVL